MAEFPALPLFTDAIIADTDHLSPYEFGLYVRILIVMWRSPEQRIPNNDTWLTRRFQQPIENIRSLISEFCQSDGNWLTQKRLKKEWRYVKESSLRQSVRSKSRWNKEKYISRGIAETHASGNAPTPTPTPTPLKKDADEDNTKNCVVLSPAIQVLEAMGVRNDPNWHGDGLRVTAWINDGANLDLDILPTIKRVMAKRNGQGPPRSLKYFDQAIADAKASRLNPLPAGNAQANGHSPPKRRDGFSKIKNPHVGSEEWKRQRREAGLDD